MVAILSVSADDFSSDCREVIAHMRSLGLNGDVTCNKTVLDGRIENGCRVIIASTRAKPVVNALWQELRKTHAVTCAHVTIESDRESGCILDVMRPSVCPGKAEQKK